jgi:glycosyltransferase involved in cell wall biosynthesis
MREMKWWAPGSRAEVGESKAKYSPRRLRVAFVNLDMTAVGGAEVAAHEWIRRLSERVEFEVVSATIDPEIAEVVTWHKVSVPQAPFVVRFPLFYFRAGLLLRRLDVDLRHSGGAFVPNMLDIVSMHFSHKCYVRRSRRLAPPGVKGLQRIAKAAGRVLGLLAETWTLREGRVSILAGVSEDQREELQDVFPRLEVAVTPNGCDAEQFRPDPDTRRKVRHDEILGDDAVVALFCGSDWERKGLSVAIDGLATLRNRSAADVRLWVVGRGDESRFVSYANEVGVSDRVRFFGYQINVSPFCQASDVFLLPTLYETFCIAAYEAAATGLPIIGTDVSGIRELVGNDEAGILIRRSSTDVARALEVLSGDSARRRSMGEVGKSRARAYNWDASARAVMGLYLRLTER